MIIWDIFIVLSDNVDFIFCLHMYLAIYDTEYCKKIQEKEIERRKYYESSSDEEGGKHSSDEDNLHHPFKVREAGPIIMDIPVRLIAEVQFYL